MIDNLTANLQAKRSPRYGFSMSTIDLIYLIQTYKVYDVNKQKKKKIIGGGGRTWRVISLNYDIMF